MGTISYPTACRFQAGSVATAASLDTAFSTVASAWTSLDSSNFRKFAGIKNENKASPYSVVVGGTNFRTLTFDHTAPLNYYGIFSYPHSQVVDTVENLDEPALGAVPFVPTFKIKNVQITYDSISGNHASDQVKAGVLYVAAGNKTAGFYSAGMAGDAISNFTAGTIQSTALTTTDAVACHLYLYLAPYVTTTGTRTLTNVSAWVTLEVPHVSG